MRNLLTLMSEGTMKFRGGYFAPLNSTKTSNGSCVVGVLTSEGASIQHPFSIHSASVQHPMQSGGTQVKSSFRLLRYAACMLLLLCLGVVNAWGTSAVALTAGEYSMTSATATGASKKFGMYNNIFYGRNGGSMAASLEVKNGTMIALKIAQASVVKFYIYNSKTSGTTADKWYIRSISSSDFDGIISQYDAAGNAATYYTNTNEDIDSLEIDLAYGTRGYTTVSKTLDAGIYGFYLKTHDRDGNFVERINIAAVASKDYTVTASTSTGTDTYGTVEAEDSSLDEGETTTITATPATGYQVTNWAVSGTGASISPSDASNSTTTTLTMGSANATVTATFGLIDYTVSKTLTNCAVKAGSSAFPSTLNYGDDFSTIIEPTSGYLLPGSITVSGVSSYTWNALTGALTLTDVTGNVSVSITAATPQTGTSKTITYNMITSGSTAATYSSSIFSNVLSGSVSAANTVVASSTMKGGNGVDVKSGKTTPNNSYTAGITSSTSDFAAGSTPYAEFRFDVVDGYTFTPTGISVPVQPISNAAYFKILITDGSSTWTTTSSSCSAGSLTTITTAPTGGAALTGTVYVRVYCYSQENSATGYRFKTPITVTGTVAVAATCSSAYSFHYGPNGGAWETPICFEQVGETHEWNITNFTIPDHTNGEFWVGYGGSTNGQSATKRWTDALSDLGGGTMNGAMVLLPTNGSVVGPATGATGTLVIWDNSSSKNQYVGFRPDGYSIKYSSTNHPFTETATENVWETELLTLPNCTTTYTMEIKTASGYTTCYHSKAAEALSSPGNTMLKDGKKYIYLDAGVWRTGTNNEHMAVYDVTNSEWGTGGGFMTYNSSTSKYEGYVSASAETIAFARILNSESAPSWTLGKYLNQTKDISLTAVHNLFTINNWGDDDGKSGYTASVYAHPATGDVGKFRMYSNSNDNNWYVHWVPYYELSYDANGGTGSVASSYGSSELSSSSHTVAANGFTREGWRFAGWNTNKYGTGTDYAPGDNIDITGDQTLYAKWERDIYLQSNVSWWYNDNAWFAVYCFDSEHDTNYKWVSMSRAEVCSSPAVYKVALPGNNFDKVIFCRMKAADTETLSWDNKDNQTGNITFPTLENDKFTISNGDNGQACTGSWGTYSAPTYTISFADGGGSGSMSSISSIACNADQAITANSFTKSGYDFSCWHADVDVKIDDATVDTGDDIADGATIQNIQDDITLTAQWTYATYSITYKDGGNSSFSGTHETGYPETHTYGTATSLYKATKTGCAFAGWYTNSSCTGDAVTSLGATDYDDDIILYARWVVLDLHEPGTYEAPTSEGGYGRVLKMCDPAGGSSYHDYEAYMVGRDTISIDPLEIQEALYAGPKLWISDGYKMFTGAADSEIKGDNINEWVAVKAYGWSGSGNLHIDEFNKLASSTAIKEARYAQLNGTSYVQLRVKGYNQFSFIGKLYNYSSYPTEVFTVKIDGVPQVFSSPKNSDLYVYRFDITTDEHFIEVSAESSSNSHAHKFYGFSLRLPDVTRYTVSATNTDGYGSVDVTSISNVRTGSTIYTSSNTLTVGGTTVTATANSTTDYYSYSFNNWTKGDGTSLPSTVTGAITVRANFTQTPVNYKLAWDKNGGSTLTGTYTTGSTGYGTSIIAPNDPTRDGYTFTGWNTEDDGSGDAYTGYMPAANVTYYAQWEEEVYEDQIVWVKNSSHGGEGKCMSADDADKTAKDNNDKNDIGHSYVQISSTNTGMRRPANVDDVFSVTFTAKSGYYIQSICTYGKIEESSGAYYSWDGGSNWTNIAQYSSQATKTFDAPDATEPTSFIIKYTCTNTGSGGIYWRNAVVTLDNVTPSYALTWDFNGGACSETAGDDYTAGGDVTYGTDIVFPSTLSMSKPGYKFTGWSDGTSTYNEGDDYMMPDDDVEFTAQWESFELPNVSGLGVDDGATLSSIPLSWTIPGICDLSDPQTPSAKNTGTITSQSYSSANNAVTVIGDAPEYEQFGVGFNIPATKKITWVSYECIAVETLASNLKLWAGVYASSTGKMYWEFEESPLSIHPGTSDWVSAGPYEPYQPYWGESDGGSPISNPINLDISQVAIFGNSEGGNLTGQKFSVRNVRYGVSGQNDIDHIVLMRKEGSAATGIADPSATKLYEGTKSHYTDNSDVTGKAYYYTVFSVHSNGAVSTGASTHLTVYTITYSAGANGTGSIAAGKKTGGIDLTLSSSTFTRDGFTQDGWSTSDGGDKVYELGDTYDEDEDITLYPHWVVVSGPVITNGSPTGGTIAITSDGETPILSAVSGNTVYIAATPSTGYNFTSWDVYKTDDDETKVSLAGSTASTTFTMPSYAVTVDAAFTAKTYTVNLNGNGGTGNTANVTATYNSSTLSSSISNPSKTGYIFGGWYSGSGGTGSLIINTSGVLQTSVDGYTGAGGIWTKDATTTLYAKWTRDVDQAKWGTGYNAFPDNSSDKRKNVTVTTSETTHQSGDIFSGNQYYNFGDGDYIDINLDEGYEITDIKTCSYNDPWRPKDGITCNNNDGCEDVDTKLYINFSSAYTYSSSAVLNAEPILLTPNTYGRWTIETYKNTLASIPEGAKSARIFADGSYDFGADLFYLEVERTALDCTPSTVTFAAGGGTGTAPSSRIECGEMTLPGKGSLAKKGNTFTGWSDGTSTYEEGDTYDVTEDVTFTAQWSPFVVPVVTGLEIDDDYALTWSIPGKLNLSTATLSDDDNYFIVYQTPAGSQSYNAATEELTITYTAAADYQKGVAIPFTGNNLESITYDYKGHRVFPAVVKSADETLYWEYDVVTTSADWTRVTRTPSTIYPNEGTVMPLPTAKAITFCANPNASKTDEPFYIRNVFYHCTGMIDVDHVVLMRKEGSAATDTTEAGTATRLYSGKLSHYTDETAVAGKAYYYTVFSVHADGSVSAGTTVEKAVYIVTHSATSNGSYTIKVGDASATDETTTAKYGQTITLSATPSSGYVFDHWTTSGTSVTLGNANVESTTFTMPAGNVTIGAVFKLKPNIYYYKDQYSAGTYKNPKGETASSGDNNNLTTPWTISQSVAGVTKVEVTNGQYDGKGNYMDAYIKLAKDGDASKQNIIFTIAEGYEATISMKIGGYSSNPTVTLKPYDGESLGSNITKTTGYATVGGVATTENNFNEIRWSDLEAGDYVLNVSSQNAYISEIDIQTVLVGYTITNANPSNGTIAITDGSSAITSAEEDATVHIAATPSTGYNFTSWSVTETESGDDVTVATSSSTNPTTFTMPGVAVTVDATFTEITHSVSVAAGAHGSVSTSSVSGVGIATASGNITATPDAGYTFAGWTLQDGVTAADGFDSDDNPIQINATADGKTITATWSATEYDITYTLHDSDDEATVSGNTTYTIEDEDYDLPTPEWDGHVFQGWYATYSAGEYSNPVSILASGSTGDKEYHAKWGSAVTVNWTATANAGLGKFYRGGGSHTILAEIDDDSWDASGDEDDLLLSASEGVILGEQTRSINGSGKAQVTASFDITEDVDGDAITFTLTAPAAESYGAIEDDKNVSLDACPGGYSIIFTSSNKNDAGSNFADLSSGNTQLIGNGTVKMIATGDCKIYSSTNQDGYRADRCAIVFKFTKATDLDIYYCAGSSSRSFALYSFSSANDLATISTSDYGTRTAVTSVTGAKASFANTSVTSSNPSISSGTVATSGSGGGIKASYSSLAAGYYVLLTVNGEGYYYGFDIDGGDSNSGVDTDLGWETDLSSGVAKEVGDPDFTFTASADNNSLGAVTYSSSAPSVATVNSTTGKVRIVGAGSATITATLAESGCYNGNTATYDITVTSDCSDVAGTVTAENLGCEGVQLTVSGYTDGATIAWWKNGSAITPAATGTTYLATVAGEYYAVTTNSCSLASNSITLEVDGDDINPTIFADEFTVKDGRPFEYRLMQLAEGESWTVSAETWDENDFMITQDENNILTIIGNADVATDGTEHLTINITNECTGNEDVEITIHTIAAGYTPQIAWLATGTKGEKACKASESTNTDLYQALEEAGYDMTAYNAYWTVDEAELIKEYSQYDLIILTDYPDSQKGPNSDKNRSKSYTNALGLLIDHVPMLTFEAFVAGCPNWDIPSNPKNTSGTVNSLTLLCNAGDVFGDTSGDFEAGDAVEVGSVGSGQALQGFALDALPDFVFIAEITDEEDNHYITCCERQTNPSARMMVFGLNGNVMDAITEEGKQMVAGFVEYMLISDAASIPDCSVIFTGGGGNSSWYNTANWQGGALPSAYASVRLDKPCEVPNNASPAMAGNIKIHVSTAGDTYTGKLTINPQGTMIVEKMITRVEDGAIANHMPTEPEDLVVEADEDHTGALIFSNPAGRTQATVQMYSKAYKDEGTYLWQYSAVPLVSASRWNMGDYAYCFNNADGDWLYDTDVYSAFSAVGITSMEETPTTYTFEGALASTTTQRITLYTAAAGNDGYNMVGNSWTAPIHLVNFDEDDFGGADYQINIYNTGHDSEGGAEEEIVKDTPGQWKCIPISSAQTAIAGGTWADITVIPSMQGFEVHNSTGSNTTLTLDYDKLVRDIPTSATMNEPMRAPDRNKDTQEIPSMRVTLSDNEVRTHIYLFSGEQFSEGFDNGWDGEYFEGEEDGYAALYIPSPIGDLGISAKPEMDGTMLGFVAGVKENYTFTFAYNGNEDLYLNDLLLEQSTLIDNENEYTFTAVAGENSPRFIISSVPYEITQTPTGVSDLDVETTRAKKILYQDKIYIIRGGRVYSIDGALVK